MTSEVKEIILCHLSNSRHIADEATMDDCGNLADSILSALVSAGWSLTPDNSTVICPSCKAEFLPVFTAKGLTHDEDD